MPLAQNGGLGRCAIVDVGVRHRSVPAHYLIPLQLSYPCVTVDNSVSVGVEEEDVEEQYDPDLGELMGVAGGGRSEGGEVAAPNIFKKADISVKLPNVGTRPVRVSMQCGTQ